MGFDNECIINIQSLAGEYFCPVCRLLVYPNEALQSQCTHLYCKPCLTYVVGTTRACPYDGYLVTEADSKPLTESNKALSETIGNIAVHCLYHRSGCQWQGPLSECTSHCSGCAFGNSPVVCNRCGIQIVHRQVQEHAQTCPGVQSQAQQAEGVQDAVAVSTATSSIPQQTQAVNQSGASISQAIAVASASVPTPEQLYQQQYQQYYQQYPGYDPYQQAYQQYYQQQAVQQYQQHPPPMPVQQLSQVYSQPQPQAQPHLQPQTHIQPQTHPLSQTQHPHAQPQPIQHVQAPVAAQNSVNQQHQLHASMQHPTQTQSQAHPPPQGHPQLQTQLQPQPYAGSQAHSQANPNQLHSQQPIQMPQYQQPQPQFQHSQQQFPPHPQQQTLPQPQAHLPVHSQAPVSHPHPQLQAPPLPSQPPTINAQLQTQYSQAHAVTGNQSYPQPQTQMQMQVGSQHPPHMHVQSGPISQHHVQMPVHFPQQPPPQMRPLQSHAPMPGQQRPVLLSPQGQVQNVPSVQQPIHPNVQQPSNPVHQRPVMQPVQPPVPQQHVQHQQQTFPVQASVPSQNQLHPHGYLVQQQQFMQAQLRPPGPPHPMQQNSLAYMSSQQPSHGLPPHQSQNYASRPMMPNGTQSQLFPQPPGLASVAQAGPMQFSGNQTSTDQNHMPRTNQLHVFSEQNSQSVSSKPTGFERQSDHTLGKSVADQINGSPSHRTAQIQPNGLVPVSNLGALAGELKNFKSETDVLKSVVGDEERNIQVDVHVKDSTGDVHAVGNASSEPAIKHMVKTEGDNSGVDSSPGITAVEIVAAEHKDATDGPQRGQHPTGNDTAAQLSEALKGQSGNLPKIAVAAGMLAPVVANTDSKALPLAETYIPDISANSQTPINSGQVHGKGLMPPPHPFPPTDQGRHQHLVMHYGPSNHQQEALLPGPPYRVEVPGQPPNILRPQGPGYLPPPPGQPLNPIEHLPPPVLKQPHGSFHHEFVSGGIPGPSSAALGQGPSHFAPQRHCNQGHLPPPHAGLPRMSQGEPPGSFNSPGAIMGREPPHGPEAQFSQQPPINSINPLGSDDFSKQRPRYLDGGQPDSHFLGSSDHAPFGQSPGIESSVMRMKEGGGVDSYATLGFRGERTEEGLGRFPKESAWRGDRGEFEEDLKQFPRHPHFDNEVASKFGNYHSSSRFNDRDPLVKAPHGGNYDAGLQLDPGAGGPRFLPPYHPGGPNEARPVGPDGNIVRTDPTRPDFLGPVPGFGRHHMDRPIPRSPGREYSAFPPRDFGGLSGFPRNQSGPDDIEGPHPFGAGPRTSNFPSDPVGNSFHENRFPLLPGHLRNGEFDGPANVRNNDLFGPDIVPSHLRRGEFLGHRNLPGHLRFGAFTGHSRMGELDAPGNFPRHQPFGEPFGSNKSGHPRLGEPGFRSSYSVAGGMDPFEHSRKRKSSSMGWCRICKVDCETVEGLDLHSQTREHQKMAMDMVLSIKQQSKKQQKTSHDQSSAEEPSKSRGPGNEVGDIKA